MSLVVQSLSAGSREQEFCKKFARCYVLGSDHDGVTERYSVESDCSEFNFGLVVAIAITAVKPKALLAETRRMLFVGFDSFIAAVQIANQSWVSEPRLLRLDGVFVDMLPMGNGNVCVIHELGALLVTTELAKVWSVSTDIVSDWNVDDELKTLSLTEADSDVVIRFSTTTGSPLD